MAISRYNLSREIKQRKGGPSVLGTRTRRTVLLAVAFLCATRARTHLIESAGEAYTRTSRTWGGVGMMPVIAAEGRISPPQINPFNREGETYSARVVYSLPPFTTDGPDCMTIAATNCTFSQGLVLILSTKAPPKNGTRPLIRILISSSTLLTGATADSALLVQGNAYATRNYRLEVSVANSTVRAQGLEQTLRANIQAIHFSQIHLVNSNITIVGCEISAVVIGARSVALFIDEGSLENSAIRVLNSSLEARSGNSVSSYGNNYAATIFVTFAPFTNSSLLYISESRFNSTSFGHSCACLTLEGILLSNSTVRLENTRFVGRGTEGNALIFQHCNLDQSVFSVRGGSFGIESDANTARMMGFSNGLVGGKKSIVGSVFSVQNTIIKVRCGSGRALVFEFMVAPISAFLLEIIGGSIEVLGETQTQLWGFWGPIETDLRDSIFRTNGTAITCITTTGLANGLMIDHQVRNTIFGFYGGTFSLAGSQPHIWIVVNQPPTNLAVTFILSDCSAVLNGTTKAAVLWLSNSVEAINALLYWYNNTYRVTGAMSTLITPSYRCNETQPCPNLKVHVDDPSTPSIGAYCPAAQEACLAMSNPLAPFVYSKPSAVCPTNLVGLNYGRELLLTVFRPRAYPA